MIIRTDLYATILLEDRLLQASQKPEAGAFPSWAVIGAFLVILGAGAAHYFYLLNAVKALRPQADELVAKTGFIQNDFNNANQRILSQREKVAKRTALTHFAENRLSWAPLIELVFAATPSSIELTSVQGAGFSQENATLRVSGRAATRNPKLECDKFRLLLIEAVGGTGIGVTGKFVRLEELSSPAKASGEAFLTAEFVIELTLQGESHGK